MNEMTNPVAGNGAKRVLLVDDDAMYLAAIGRYLEQNGWRCTLAVSAAEALDRVQAEEFDLALVDCWMPEASGFETLRMLGEVRPKLAVVLISAMGTEATAKEARRQGAADFISKESSSAEIKKVLEGYLGRARNAETTAASATAPERPVLSEGTILLVEDHGGYRQATARLLSRSGFRVREAANGMAALAEWEKGGLDGAIVDLHLPDTSGVEVARLFRTLDPRIAIVLISGEANKQEKAEAVRYGMTGCLDKLNGRTRLVKIARYLVDETARSRAAAARAAEPPSPARHLRRWLAERVRRGRTWSRRSEARVVVAGLVLAAVFAVALLKGMSDYELRRLDAPISGRNVSVVEMYEKVVGYLERDEEREVGRGGASRGAAR